jgi:hypothetical protein
VGGALLQPVASRAWFEMISRQRSSNFGKMYFSMKNKECEYQTVKKNWEKKNEQKGSILEQHQIVLRVWEEDELYKTHECCL